VHELIDRFAPRGRADLVREFTFAFRLPAALPVEFTPA
jgi:hypothetical protein